MFNIKLNTSNRNRYPSSTLGSGLAQGNTIRPVPKNRVNKRRSYRFTLNNYTEKEAAHLEQAFLEIGINKFCFQEEIGEEKKTPHLQGCVFFKNAISFNTMKRINNRINWARLDYPKSAIKYCLKSRTRKPDGRQWYYGINPEDYKEKKKVPLMEHKDMLADMKEQMKMEINSIAKEWNKIDKEKFVSKDESDTE